MTKIQYEFDGHIIEFPSDMRHKIHDEGYHYGITFYTECSRCEIGHNRDACWSRVFISYDNGGWKDIPFKKSAFWVLPDGVEVFKKEIV